jgi:3-dehydroquinate synthase
MKAETITDKSISIGSARGKALQAFIKRGAYSSCFIICDSNTLKYCLGQLIIGCPVLKDAEVIELEPGEENKDIEVVTNIWQTLTDFGADKKSLVINLGGGVISDIGGFAASTFKRGIDFVNFPTSLLAMADASVGGKNGINFSGIKNHIGTITQPKAVFIDPAYLETLPHRHLINGYAEIFKIALIQEKKFFRLVGSLEIKPGFRNTAIISRSVKLKSKIVKKDPFDRDTRKILNFGHTLGHALESLFLKKETGMLHGEAIAVGMVIESYLSLLLKRISTKEFEIILNGLSVNFKFPQIPAAHFPILFEYLWHDKKNTGKHFIFALLNGIGKCSPAVKVSRATIEKALVHYNTSIANAS